MSIAQQFRYIANQFLSEVIICETVSVININLSRSAPKDTSICYRSEVNVMTDDHSLVSRFAIEEDFAAVDMAHVLIVVWAASMSIEQWAMSIHVKASTRYTLMHNLHQLMKKESYDLTICKYQGSASLLFKNLRWSMAICQYIIDKRKKCANSRNTPVAVCLLDWTIHPWRNICRMKR